VRFWFIGALCISSILKVESTYAYPATVGHGYTRCATCHYNPSGNGPLTDYGRSLGAVAVADRPFWLEDDNQASETSGFLGPAKLPSWLRPSGDFRAMVIVPNLGSNFTDPEPRFLVMQAEGNLVLKAFRDRLFAVGTLGYIPDPASFGPQAAAETPNVISREHYLAFRNRTIAVMAGFMDHVFGVRIADHEAYSRSRLGFSMNDQTHAAVVQVSQDRWTLGLQAFAGNLYQEQPVRQKGASLNFQFDFTKNFYVGTSVLASIGQVRRRQAVALYSGIGFFKGSSFVFETGFNRNDPTQFNSPSTAQYFLGQGSFQILRGLYLLSLFEVYAQSAFETPLLMRFGPGVQWFPAQRLEFRLDLQANRRLGGSSANQDAINLLTQVHIWL
jgi:hypothetical protein